MANTTTMDFAYDTFNTDAFDAFDAFDIFDAFDTFDESLVNTTTSATTSANTTTITDRQRRQQITSDASDSDDGLWQCAQIGSGIPIVPAQQRYRGASCETSSGRETSSCCMRGDHQILQGCGFICDGYFNSYSSTNWTEKPEVCEERGEERGGGCDGLGQGYDDIRGYGFFTGYVAAK